ncbi:p9 [Hibiscus green spot virus 2]|uniref:Binary movement block protein 2 n=2 Tax=Higrevirus waimanalo TaxID=3047949 RepID=A0AA51RFS0_9VIRU|nr:p9 [Hibiscus green spot virus 2]WMQ58798.1 binary movement block protein 2 [Higrevirus waimanalo]AER13448.1 p9 [Hibiscus green spot virus 2]WKR38945.1 p9 BM2 [Hibiscus green spot virus 2]WKR38954.1 p9 BM2 [Hibiscus green spot virus 2]WKR38961.1 p9 BM2 [Hibiscus green spot virus 2]
MPIFQGQAKSNAPVLFVCASICVIAYFFFNPGNPYNVPLSPGHVFPFGGEYAVHARFNGPSFPLSMGGSSVGLLMLCVILLVVVTHM